MRQPRPSSDLRPGDLDLGHPDTFRDGHPFDYYRVLRREAPVHWNPPHGKDFGLGPIRQGFFAVTRHADVIHVSRNPELFSSYAGSVFIHDHDAERLAGLRLMFLNQDPPAHVQSRAAVSRAFTPRMVDGLEPRIRRYARALVETVAQKGECEFVSEVAADLPLTLICEMLGIPHEDRHLVFDWSNRMVGGEDPEMSDAAGQAAAAAESWAYAQQLAAAKRARPDDTLFSRFVNGSDGARAVSEDEIANFFILLQAAGSETTRNATTLAVMLLVEHPAQQARLRANLEGLLPSAVEEIVRYSSPVIVMRRTATRETELGGQPMRAGDKVALYYGACNRDEDVFDDADTFDVGRSPNPQLGFGIGQHFCLGANLARMQLRASLREVLTQLDDIEIVGTPKRQRGTLIAGVKELHLRFRAR